MKKFFSVAWRIGTGRTMPGASIRVKASPSTTESANLVVYSDEGTTVLSQPFLTGAQGFIEFYTADNRIDIYVDYEAVSYVIRDIFHFDLTAIASASNSITGSTFVTAESESLLPSEIAISSFLGHPDIAPASANALDSEFNTYSGWTNLGHDGNTTVTAMQSRIRLQQSTTSTDAPIGITKSFTPPAGDFEFITKMNFGYFSGITGGVTSGERPMWGFGLRTNLGEVFGVFMRANAQGISVCKAVLNATNLVSADGDQIIGTNSAYLKLKRVGTDYLFQWANFPAENTSWVTVAKAADTTLFTGTIVQLGLIAVPSFDTGGYLDGVAEFVRHTAP